MRRKRLLWQIYPALLVVSFTVLIIVAITISVTLRAFYIEQAADDLLARARLMPQDMLSVSQPGSTLNSLCKELSQRAMSRVTLIRKDGVVLCDSDKKYSDMENHKERPEVIEALKKKTGKEIRFSTTLNQNMLYLALPLIERGAVVNILRLAIPIMLIDETLYTIRTRLVLVGLIIAFLVVFLSLWISHRIRKPLDDIKNGAERFASGDLRYKLHVDNSQELGELSEALNLMASQLDERLTTVERQRNEQDAVLSSMGEGVMAVDANGRVMMINRAALILFSVEGISVVNRLVWEVVRNPDIHRFLKKLQADKDPQVDEIRLMLDGKDRFVKVSGTKLSEPDGRQIGALIVLDDLTKLKRLEDLRRDFVTNVSHELKTPVTAIKGFSETLLDGAINNPKDCKRFVEVINRQSSRLEMLITDLLCLARIEREFEQQEVVFAATRVSDVLNAALHGCEPYADQLNIPVNIECDQSLLANIDAQLLEQAVINLLHNAITYSTNNSPVSVRAYKDNRSIIIEVEDFGIGIAEKHLPRLFERFYRVDKARSRKLGGTGLGLSIVKHIAISHGGSVKVKSTPAKGSLFQIYLPLK